MFHMKHGGMDMEATKRMQEIIDILAGMGGAQTAPPFNEKEYTYDTVPPVLGELAHEYDLISEAEGIMDTRIFTVSRLTPDEMEHLRGPVSMEYLCEAITKDGHVTSGPLVGRSLWFDIFNGAWSIGAWRSDDLSEREILLSVSTFVRETGNWKSVKVTDYYIAKFDSQYVVDVPSGGTDYGTMWDANPFHSGVTWKVEPDEGPCENPLEWHDEGFVHVLDARVSATTNRDKAGGFGNASVSDVEELIGLDQYDFEGMDADDIIKAAHKAGFSAMKIYMYSHSGDTIRTHPFGGRWDTGIAGFIFMQGKGHDLPEIDGDGTRAPLLTQIIETLDTWVSGDIWTYTIEDGGEVIDSLSGLYTFDDAIKGANEAALTHIMTRNG